MVGGAEWVSGGSEWYFPGPRAYSPLVPPEWAWGRGQGADESVAHSSRLQTLKESVFLMSCKSGMKNGETSSEFSKPKIPISWD